MELGICLPEDKALQISKAVIKSQMKVEWAARGSRLFLLASPLCQKNANNDFAWLMGGEIWVLPPLVGFCWSEPKRNGRKKSKVIQ